MLYNGIFINCDNLIQLAYKLKTKINDIENCYNSIKTNIKEIDGTSENWQGEDQKKFYETLTYITGKYENNVIKLKEIYSFLCKVINDYENREKAIGKNIDNNAENLDM